MKNKAGVRYVALTPEFKLILLCSPIKITEKHLPALKLLLAGPLDWDKFLALVEHHQVYPLVYQGLSSLENPTVPDQVMTVLRGKVWENTTKTLQMTGELVKVLQSMEENGLRAVVLKGFPLGYLLYGDLTLRPSRDLDILVWPEDVDQALRILEKLGYERMHSSATTSKRRLRNWMKITHHFVYWQKDREIRLELHWRFGHCGLEIPLDELEESLIQVRLAGQAVLMPGAEVLLLFLALHGASHAWFRLKWLADVGVVLRQADFSWKRLYDLSEHLGVEALLNQAVILARHLLQVPVPDHIVLRIEKDRKALSLVGRALPFITAVGYDPTDFRKALYYQRQKYDFFVQPGWRKKLTSLYSKLSPKERDLELVALPESLYCLYYLLRPFTWFRCRVEELAVNKPKCL